MSKKIAKRAKKMARESIYDDAEYLGQWNGFDVYEPTFNDDKEHIVGIPQFTAQSLNVGDGEDSLVIVQ